MADTPDLGQTPIFYPEGFTTAVSNGDSSSSSGAGASLGLASSQELLTSEKHPEPAPKEYFCGIGRWHPRWLQVFRNAKFFTFMLCANCFIEGALVSGFTSVVLSSLERRYQFPSLAAGFVAVSFDFAVLFSVIFISYFGGKGHKPRWLGISLIIQGIGAFVFSLPHFVFGRYEVGLRGELQFEACADGEDFSADCDSANGFALAFFIGGNLLVGVGAAPLFTVGTSYLDDIVHPKHVSIHLGFFYLLSVVGPALGFGLGGAFLSIYVDPGVSTFLEPSDPGWVGAWWLCFVFSGIVSVLLSIPFLMFPRLLPDSHLIKKARMEEMAKTYKSKFGEKEDTDFGTKLKSFPTHLWQVFSNPAWLFITIAIAAAFNALAGLVSFAPKYLESQFGLTASKASLFAGAVAIPSGGAGVITGALIIFCTKVKGRKVVLISWMVGFFAILSTLAFLARCPTLELAGINVKYPDGSLNDDLNSTCTLPCNCTSTIFEPVCGADGVNYFSPCRAGCDKSLQDGDPNKPIFENCTCIITRLETELGGGNVSVEDSASDGRCDDGCGSGMLGLFLVVIGVGLFLIFTLQIPNVIITIRCVAEEQRTLALGAQSLVFRAFGSIPGPIIFGLIFDSACIYWQYECGRRGNCWVYDNTNLSQRALSLTISGIFLYFVFAFLCWLVYPKKVEAGGEEDGHPGGSYSSEGVADRSAKSGVELNRMESHASGDVLLESVDHGRVEAVENGQPPLAETAMDSSAENDIHSS